MTVTVKQILGLPAYHNATLIAGQAGLNRSVQKVDIIEVPDVLDWLKPEVMYITAGYAFRDNPQAICELVQTMVDKGSAALAVKVDRYIKVIPAQAIELANKAGLPLINIPSETPFVDLTIPALTQIMDRQSYVIEQAARIHAQLTQVVLDGGDLLAVGESLANSLDNPVLIETEDLALIAACVPDGKTNISPDLVRASSNRSVIDQLEADGVFAQLQSGLPSVTWRPADGEGVGRIISPILYGRALHGYVTVLEFKELVPDVAKAALEQAATVAALVMARQQVVEETRLRMRSDLLQDLLQGNFDSTELMMQRAQYVDWDLSQKLVVIALDIDHFRQTLEQYSGDEKKIQNIKAKLVQAVENVVYLTDRKAIVSARSDSVVVLTVISGSAASFKQRSFEIAEAIKEAVDANVPEVQVTIGIGGVCEELAGVPKSYQEARQALRIGKVLSGGNKVFHIDDLSFYRLLIDSVEQDELREFVTDAIGPLLQYDQEKSAKLVQTVEKYLELGGNQTLTAQALFIHRNTLSYRLNRAAEVLGVDLDNPEIRIKLLVALRAHHFLKA